MTTPEEKTPQPKIIKTEIATFIRYHIPPDFHSKYAQHLSVQPGENEVVLSFFELIFPALYGTPELQEAMQREIVQQGIPAECVARITISNARFPAFIKAMQDVLEQATIGAGGSKDKDEPENPDKNQSDDEPFNDGTKDS